MNVKRYIAEDVPSAVEKIRTELGRDAFILSTRKVRRKGVLDIFKKPLMEVMAAYEDKPAVPEKSEKAHQPLMPPSSSVWQQPAASAGAAAVAVNAYRQASGQPTAFDTEGSLRSFAAVRTAQAREENITPLYIEDARTGLPVNTATPPEDDTRLRSIEDKIDALASNFQNVAGKMQLGRANYRATYSAGVEKLLISLLDNEVHEEFAHKIAREVNEVVARQDEDPSEVMEQILKQYMGEPAPIKLKKFKRTIVLLTGPTGVGKTTTLAKLAAIYALNHHARVGIITTDTYRIAAVDQLKTYAEILEVPVSVSYSPEDIGDALSVHEDRDIVFIDTAGRSPSDRMHEAELTDIIKYADPDEVHLVISATTGFTGCLNIVNTYSYLRDYKLLFTKLDESPSWGTLLNMRFLSDRPVSYMAAGQNVPDDIEVAGNAKIIERLMGKS